MPDPITRENPAKMKTKPFNWPIVGLLLFLAGIPAIPAPFLMTLAVMGPSANELSSIVNALHFQTPAAVLVHGSSGIAFFLSMPFQFSPLLRAKKPKRHKIAGIIALASGYVMALSGIWMHHVLSPDSFGARYLSLVTLSAAICIAFSMALTHILNGNVPAHRAWMCRAVAITLGVVTPLFIDILLYLASNSTGNSLATLYQLQHDYGRLLGMAINLGIVEYALHRGRRERVSQIPNSIGVELS
ncbi:MAG TPA: DUF2306 domain-containing protein [Marinagarivorans sp.]